MHPEWHEQDDLQQRLDTELTGRRPIEAPVRQAAQAGAARWFAEEGDLEDHPEGEHGQEEQGASPCALQATATAVGECDGRDDDDRPGHEQGRAEEEVDVVGRDVGDGRG